jgi:SLT domain-containing protein
MWVAEKIGVIGGAVGSAIEAVGKAAPEYKNMQRDAFSMGKMMANGGIATMPMICGERGPEMVIPLSHDRAARGAQLTQNFIQNFSMSGNETTALSLSQAVRSRDFTRAMSNNAYISGRLGR